MWPAPYCFHSFTEIALHKFYPDAKSSRSKALDLRFFSPFYFKIYPFSKSHQELEYHCNKQAPASLIDNKRKKIRSYCRSLM